MSVFGDDRSIKRVRKEKRQNGKRKALVPGCNVPPLGVLFYRAERKIKYHSMVVELKCIICLDRKQDTVGCLWWESEAVGFKTVRAWG